MGNLPKYHNSVFAAVVYSYAVMKVLTGLGNKNIKEAPPQPPPEPLSMELQTWVKVPNTF